VTEAAAVVASAVGALSLTWAWVEVVGYVRRRRRGQGPRGSGYVRMRVALAAALVTVGAVLGMAIGSLLRA
jgi:hypothetical protein